MAVLHDRKSFYVIIVSMHMIYWNSPKEKNSFLTAVQRRNIETESLVS